MMIRNPLKMKWGKKSGRYELSQDVFVLTVHMGDMPLVQCTLSSVSTARHVIDYIREKIDLQQAEFFGLRYELRVADPDRRQMRWVEIDRPLRKQLEKWACRPRQLQLAILYHTPNVFALHDQMARSLYFMLLKLDVLSGRFLKIDAERYVQLAAYDLQVEQSDYDPTIHTVDYLKTLRLLPEHLCRQSQLHDELLIRIVNVYESLAGMQAACAANRYIVDVQQCQGYGEEHFVAKDDESTEVKLSYSLEEIFVQRYNGTKLKFNWSHVKNVTATKRNLILKCVNGTSSVFTFEDVEMARYVAMVLNWQWTYATTDAIRHKSAPMSVENLQSGFRRIGQQCPGYLRQSNADVHSTRTTNSVDMSSAVGRKTVSTVTNGLVTVAKSAPPPATVNRSTSLLETNRLIASSLFNMSQLNHQLHQHHQSTVHSVQSINHPPILNALCSMDPNGASPIQFHLAPSNSTPSLVTNRISPTNYGLNSSNSANTSPVYRPQGATRNSESDYCSTAQENWLRAERREILKRLLVQQQQKSLGAGVVASAATSSSPEIHMLGVGNATPSAATITVGTRGCGGACATRANNFIRRAVGGHRGVAFISRPLTPIGHASRVLDDERNLISSDPYPYTNSDDGDSGCEDESATNSATADPMATIIGEHPGGSSKGSFCPKWCSTPNLVSQARQQTQRTRSQWPEENSSNSPYRPQVREEVHFLERIHMPDEEISRPFKGFHVPEEESEVPERVHAALNEYNPHDSLPNMHKTTMAEAELPYLCQVPPKPQRQYNEPILHFPVPPPIAPQLDKYETTVPVIKDLRIPVLAPIGLSPSGLDQSDLRIITNGQSTVMSSDLQPGADHCAPATVSVKQRPKRSNLLAPMFSQGQIIASNATGTIGQPIVYPIPAEALKIAAGDMPLVARVLPPNYSIHLESLNLGQQIPATNIANWSPLSSIDSSFNEIANPMSIYRDSVDEAPNIPDYDSDEAPNRSGTVSNASNASNTPKIVRPPQDETVTNPTRQRLYRQHNANRHETYYGSSSADLDKNNNFNAPTNGPLGAKLQSQPQHRHKNTVKIKSANAESILLNVMLAKLAISQAVETEFAGIPAKRLSAGHSTSQCPDNQARNRAGNVFPYEDTRVMLASHKRNIDGYINASHVKAQITETCQLNYIVAQAPMRNTVEDFWRMIWECETRLVVMLVNPHHIHKTNACPAYWPFKVGEKLRFGGPMRQHTPKSTPAQTPTMIQRQKVELRQSAVDRNQKCITGPIIRSTKGTSGSIDSTSPKGASRSVDECQESLTVQLISTSTVKCQTTSVLSVKWCGNPSRIVYHMCCADFTDEGTPSSIDAFLGFIDAVNSIRKHIENEDHKEHKNNEKSSKTGLAANKKSPKETKSNGERKPQGRTHYGSAKSRVPIPPIVVHCTDGASECGIFVLVEVILRRIENNAEVDVAQVLRSLRQQRMCLVEKPAQYRFVYELIAAYLQRSRLI